MTVFKRMEIKIMLKFDEQKQLDSVNGALALRGRIEENR